MRTSLTLLAADVKAMKDWFRTQSFSKLLVFSGFIAVLLSVSFILYVSTYRLFHALASFEEPGFLMATYIIHAALVVILWLGVGSSVISSTTSFLVPRNLDYLVSLPIKENSIILWLFIKTTIVNVVFLFITLAPLAFSFALSFSVTFNWHFLFRLLFILFALAIFTNSIGAMLAFAVVTKVQGKGYLGAFVGLVVFLLGTFVLLRFVFPPQLLELYQVSFDKFVTFYNRLPLSNNALPTSWLTKVLIEGRITETIYTAFLSIALALASLGFQSKKFLFLFQTLASKSTKPIFLAKGLPVKFDQLLLGNASFGQILTSSSRPLFFKDWLSVVRSPSETGYGLFLLSLALFSLLFFSQAGSVPEINNEWQTKVVIFSFMWLIFFATAFFLRLVFPLMAREADSAWHLFTMPIPDRRILSVKILFAIILSLPLVVLSIVVWFFIPFVTSLRTMLITTSIWAMILLAIVHGLLGSISPNFASGKDPEKVSTSGMGIVTLVLSLLIGFLFSRSIQGIINQSATVTAIFSFYILTSCAVIWLLYLVSIKNIARYQF